MSGEDQSRQNRKDSHIALCLNEQVEYSQSAASGFANYRFDHDALPEVDRSKIDLSTTLLGQRLALPLIIGAMTGGTPRARQINERLARAAEKCKIGFALGSQRPLLELNNESVRLSYAVREVAPAIPLLFGNIGAVQLNYGVGVREVETLIRTVSADAFFFHLNPLQEAVQPEGNTNFSSLLPKLYEIASQIKVPIFLKEVGSGISETTALKISSAFPNLAGIETAGVGGTSWSKVESLRTDNAIQKGIGELFSAEWGVPTAESIMICRKVFFNKTIIGSGGIRNGIDAAKALVLGADAVAIALPFLKAADQSQTLAENVAEDAVITAIQKFAEELRTVLFLTGSKNIAELKTKSLRYLR